MVETPTVWVIVEPDKEEIVTLGERSGKDVGGGFGDRSPEKVTETIQKRLSRKRISLDAHLLKEQMAGLLAVVEDLFEQASQQPQMKLQELELSVEIDGEGQVNLVGNGAKLSNSGGITMKFVSK